VKREPTCPDTAGGLIVRSAAHDLLRDLLRDWRRWSTPERVAAGILLVAVLSALSIPVLAALIHPIA
jgi:hypothetical protein